MKATMKTAVFAVTAVAVAAMSSSINAATVSNLGVNFDPGIQPVNPAPVSTTGGPGTVSNSQVGSLGGEYRSPFESTTHPNYVYSFVQAGSTATFNVGGLADTLSII